MAQYPRPCHIFTDGSCFPNNKSKFSQGGYAVLICSSANFAILYGKLDTRETFATNIRAEGTALYRALKYLYLHRPEGEIVIHTDSEFWINMILKYMPKWSEKDFESHVNSDLTRRVNKYWKALGAVKTVTLRHIYSHNKKGDKTHPSAFRRFCYEQNSFVDRLATFARKQKKLYCAIDPIGQDVIRFSTEVHFSPLEVPAEE